MIYPIYDAGMGLKNVLSWCLIVVCDLTIEV